MSFIIIHKLSKYNFSYYHENKFVRKKSTRAYFQRAIDMIRQKRKHCCNRYKKKP